MQTPEPYEIGELEVSDGHRLYYECVGDPDGLPAVYLHGGPGAGVRTGPRAYFDPTRYRTVLFEQRGCGRSRPLASSPEGLVANTTQDLIADIERLRVHLGIERWVVTGVSWGSTLALAYAEAHPDRVLGIVVAAVTIGTREEIRWITRDIGRVFPEAWERFVGILDEGEREGDLSFAYARLLRSGDDDARRRAALEWCRWEDTHVSLMPGWTHSERFDDPQFALVFATLVTHYWSNQCFLEDDQIMRELDRITHLPCVLIHGRYDVSGPLESAWRLHRAWPGSRLVVLEGAGHGGDGFVDAVREALDDLVVD